LPGAASARGIEYLAVIGFEVAGEPFNGSLRKAWSCRALQSKLPKLRKGSSQTEMFLRFPVFHLAFADVKHGADYQRLSWQALAGTRVDDQAKSIALTAAHIPFVVRQNALLLQFGNEGGVLPCVNKDLC
jgi:hypothetical protein